MGVIPVDPKGVVPKSTTFRRRFSGRGTSAAASSPGEKKGNRENEQEHLGLYLKHGEATDLNVWIDFTLRKE